MTANRTCPECQTPLPADAPVGLCPRCLLQRGLGSDSSGTTTGFGPFTPPSVAELAPLFPQLEIVELLGQGGMGAVYKARQPGLDRLVALKILPPAADVAFAERFTREARTLAKLSHPGIVTVHDFGQAGGFYYFVMEFVEGVNLRQAQKAHKLTPPEALAIVPKICEALQFAHEAGIVHRDIKPENILVDAKGRVKIADFGLAKLLDRGSEQSHLTGTQQVMGTLHYMAPEQWEKPLTVDHRADIYSLGVVFYELLTGELPLGRFAPPSQKVQMDVRIDEIVLRTLEKEPDLRYQHASDVKTDVERISGTTPVQIVRPKPAQLANANPTRARQLKEALAKVLAIIGVLGLVSFFSFEATSGLDQWAFRMGSPDAWLVWHGPPERGGLGFEMNFLRWSMGIGLASIIALSYAAQWWPRNSAMQIRGQQSAATPTVEPPITAAPGFMRSLLLPVFGLLVLFVALIGLGWLFDLYIDPTYFDGPPTIFAYVFMALQVFAILWFLEWMWGIITRMAVTLTGQTRNLMPLTLSTWAIIVCVLGAANAFTPWYILTTQSGDYWLTGINLHHGGAGVTLSGVFLALGLFLFATANVPSARSWQIAFTGLAGIGLLVGTVYGINRLRGESLHLMTAELIRVLNHPASGDNQTVYHIHPSFGAYAVGALGALLLLIAVIELRNRMTEARPLEPARSAPGFLRSVLWPVLALAAIAVGSAGVAMTKSFGSFRGPAQIVNGFSTVLVPVVFVALMIRWMWLTLRPQRQVMFWVLAAGLTLVLALGYSGAFAVIFMRGGAAPKSEIERKDPRQELLVGIWTWTDGREGTSEFRADGTFEERWRERYSRMTDSVNGPEKVSGVNELSLNGQYEWIGIDRIRARAPSSGEYQFRVVIKGTELTILEDDGDVKRLLREVREVRPTKAVKDFPKAEIERKAALIGTWTSTIKSPSGIVRTTFRSDGTFENEFANGVVSNGQYNWPDSEYIEKKYQDTPARRYEVVMEGDTLTLLGEKGEVHRMKLSK